MEAAICRKNSCSSGIPDDPLQRISIEGMPCRDKNLDEDPSDYCSRIHLVLYINYILFIWRERQDSGGSGCIRLLSAQKKKTVGRLMCDVLTA